MPRVTIITPTYNHAAYIGECIESVIAQTFTDWEMLIVNDGSTDGTAEVVRRYDDPRIRLLDKANGGIMNLHENYNLALREARGELLAILEGDDYWPADKLALQVPHFDDPSVVLVSGFAAIVDDERNDLGRIPPKPLPASVRNNRPVGTATLLMMLPASLNFTYPVATMLRKSAVERIGGFRQTPDLPLVDYPTFLAISLEGEFRFVEKTCGYWRRHAQSTTFSRLPQILEGCYREAMRFGLEEGPRMNLDPEGLRGQSYHWEAFQSRRCTLLARLLSKEKRPGDASRALEKALGYRQSRRDALLLRAALRVASRGLPIEWIFRAGYFRSDLRDLDKSVAPDGDPLVLVSDLDREWPFHPHTAEPSR